MNIMLKPNKTMTINTPLYDRKLTRVGVIFDESFFHAIVYTVSKTYRTYDTEEKIKIVKQLRNCLANELSVDIWKQLSNTKFDIEETLVENLNDIYSYVNNGKFNSDSDSIYVYINEYNDVISIGLDLIDLKWLYNNILKCLTSSIKEVVYPEYSEQIRKYNISLVKKKYIWNILSKLFKLVIEKSEKQAYNSFTEKLRTHDELMDLTILEHVSNIMDIDIYFLDATDSNLLYIIGDTSTIKNRKSIVLYCKNNYFEPIGLDDKFEFSTNHDFISKLKKIILKR